MINTTPVKEGSKRFSSDFTARDVEDIPKSPQTPSPPNSNAKGRRSSTSMSFLPSPSLHNRNSGFSSMFTVPQSPSMKTRLLPPTTPKSKHAEVFLSPSPNLKSPGVYKETEKPIREISNNLKTRLNYAFMKLQNGWTDKTLSELENEFTKKKHERIIDEGLEGESDTNNYTDDKRLPSSSYSNKLVDLDEDNGNSAHVAFLKALSSPKKKQRSASSSSVNWNDSPPKLPPITTNVRKSSQPSEVEAIETLMSLSSPQKRKHSTGVEYTLPPPPLPLTRQADQNRLSVSSSSSASSLQNTLAKPFALRHDGQEPPSVVLTDVETDIEDDDG